MFDRRPPTGTHGGYLDGDEGLTWAEQVAARDAEIERLRAELDRWTSGRRRKTMPVVDAVPDGLHYAAALVRAQGTEGGEEHDQLLTEAGQRMKALWDAASRLIVERDQLRFERDELQVELDADLRAEAACLRRTNAGLKATVDAMDDPHPAANLGHARKERDELRAEVAELRAERDAARAEAERLRSTIAEAVAIGDMTPLFGWTAEDRRRMEEFNATLPAGPEDGGET